MLFSEPKIPQFRLDVDVDLAFERFSALQRAENSSIVERRRAAAAGGKVSVLFSEPKIPQYRSAPV